MDFNLSAKGRPTQIKAALKEQVEAITDEQSAKCAEIVATGLGNWLEEQDPKEALSVSARVWGHSL